jgi:hypothetical protein
MKPASNRFHGGCMLVPMRKSCTFFVGIHPHENSGVYPVSSLLKRGARAAVLTHTCFTFEEVSKGFFFERLPLDYQNNFFYFPFLPGIQPLGATEHIINRLSQRRILQQREKLGCEIESAEKF